MPVGTRIQATFWWDNSADNPANPDPTAEVTFGRPTTSEMGYGLLSYLTIEPEPLTVGEPVPQSLLAAEALARRGGR